MAAYRNISFEKLHPNLMVRVIEDGNYMIALDLLSALTGNDRKRASQTLARIASKPETSDLLTLRHSADGKKTPRKLISFPHAIQLLLTLPKRTVDLKTRRTVAEILVEFFETADTHRSAVVTPSAESLVMQQTRLQIEQHTMDLEQRRKRQPLENLRFYFDFAQQCGLLTDEEKVEFKRMASECLKELA